MSRDIDSVKGSKSLPQTYHHKKLGKDNGRRSNSNRFRLERFGKAMSGTDGWEAPGAALNGIHFMSNISMECMR